MNQSVEKIANAVMYEGYMLYPYRPSVKNHRRWTFGGLYPESSHAVHGGFEKSHMQAECLLESAGDAKLSARIRFLQLIDRVVELLPDDRRVVSVVVDGKEYQSWQEAAEREISVADLALESLAREGYGQSFCFPAASRRERILSADQIAAHLRRTQESLRAQVSIQAAPIGEHLWRLRLRVINTTPLSEISGNQTVLQSLAATHMILEIDGGRFLSLTDPPETLALVANECRNIGCWPVLAGPPESRSTLLVSPIILPDYPQVAPESPGDLFDGAEIDEILSLRILTLTEEEKRRAAALDHRVRDLLERTESLAPAQLQHLHGTLREVTPESLDPLTERRSMETTLAAGIELHPGDRVRLRPTRRADIFDMALNGKTARIAAIEQDFENRIHLAVTVDEDPGSDLGAAGRPGHRFFFSPEEVEVLERSTS